MALEIKKVVYGVVELINKYKAYGWLIFLVMAICVVFSYSAYDYTQSHEKAYANEKETWLDAYHKVNDKLESLDKRTSVIESKIDLLIHIQHAK